MRKIKVLVGSSHPDLADLILHKLGLSATNCSLKRFSNAEVAVDLKVSVRDDDVFIIQSGSANINDDLMELLILVNACKASAASRITAVVPYFPCWF